jgi:hypothetical protein
METAKKEEGCREGDYSTTCSRLGRDFILSSKSIIPTSPQRGESSQNKYVELVNLEEINEEIRETQDDKEGENKVDSENADLTGKG